MRIDWYPDNSPHAATLIAHRTLDAIREMDAARTQAEIRRLFDEWMKFARSHRVCRQICEHMADKKKLRLKALDDDRPRPRDWQRAAAADL